MRTETVNVAEAPADLAGAPVGSRVVTATGKVMELDELEGGDRYWIEPGTLSPFSKPPANWFPALILPEPDPADPTKSTDKGFD